MVKDVSDGKIVSEGGINQRSSSHQNSGKGCHAGAARRFSQTITDGILAYGGNHAYNKTVSSQRQSE
jgi:hypothetical protein